MEHKGLLFKIVTVEHKRLPSKIITVEHKGLGVIFFLLVCLNLRKLILNYRTNSGKRMVMTWQLMWLNLSIATLNATLQLLVIYRSVELITNYEKKENSVKSNPYNFQKEYEQEIVFTYEYK